MIFILLTIVLVEGARRIGTVFFCFDGEQDCIGHLRQVG